MTGDEVPGGHLRDVGLTLAFRFLGKRWNGIILATLLNGHAGFSELRRAVGGISDSVLSERLGELSRVGLVERNVSDGPPIAVEYRLTSAGQALRPTFRELTMWAESTLPKADAELPPSA